MNKEYSWKWRDGELTMKEFHKLTSTEKQEYLLQIIKLNEEQRSSMDKILFNLYNLDKVNKIKNFISIEE